jgi:serine/threonine protein kinase
VDIWSVGVIVYMLLSGEHPFCDEDTSEAQLTAAVLQQQPCMEGKLWAGISAQAREIVCSMLVRGPGMM